MSVLIGGSTENNNIIVSKDSCKSDSSCVGPFLKTKNYLSEFKSAYEKALARQNLGIEEVRAKWGEIEGFLSEQQDLMQKFEEVDQEVAEKLNILQSQIETNLKELISQFQLLLEDKISKELEGNTAVSQIKYTNEQYPEIKTLEDALNKVLYKDLTVSLSCSPKIKEVGEVVEQITYNWTFNKSIKEQWLGDRKLDYTVRTWTLEGEFKTTTSKTLTATDGINTVTSIATLYFYPGIYYGAANELEVDDIKNMGRLLQANRKATITVDGTSNKSTYIFICIPYDYGLPTFSVNGFDGGFELVNNNFQYDRYDTGNPIRYRIYRSDYGGLGVTNIIIS